MMMLLMMLMNTPKEEIRRRVYVVERLSFDIGNTAGSVAGRVIFSFKHTPYFIYTAVWYKEEGRHTTATRGPVFIRVEAKTGSTLLLYIVVVLLRSHRMYECVHLWYVVITSTCEKIGALAIRKKLHGRNPNLK